MKSIVSTTSPKRLSQRGTCTCIWKVCLFACNIINNWRTLFHTSVSDTSSFNLHSLDDNPFSALEETEEEMEEIIDTGGVSCMCTYM